MAKIRIQKALSSAGLASRRAVEQMLLAGRITVNGRTVTELPCFVEPGDEILVDGQAVRKRRPRKVYVLLNKPRGVVCTQKDAPRYDRPRAVDLIPDTGARVYCVGRLDEDSTGLIVLTNDGELTNRLTHPRYGVEKTYLVRVAGRLTAEEVAGARRGVFLGGRRSAAAVKVLRSGPTESLVEVRLSEGRNRQVRRMLARLGHKVRRLHRSAIGSVTDRGLKIGKFRRLRHSEVASLRRLAGL
ncbi:MAG: hypothetical protein AMJ81_09720 [Phycisphaerae bacterium SM23_33]|nr:MAG: hypothetical protein AMJ81_09720 [Phycisphaerae bacterium SM23_33]